MIHLIVIIVLIGLIVHLINTYVPMDQGFKNLIFVVAFIGLILYALQIFGFNF